MREPVKKLLAAISLEKAKESKKEEMWTDPEKYPKLDEILMVSSCGTYNVTRAHASCNI